MYSAKITSLRNFTKKKVAIIELQGGRDVIGQGEVFFSDPVHYFDRIKIGLHREAKSFTVVTKDKRM